MKATVLTLALLCAGAAFAQTSPSGNTSPNASREAQHMENLATLLDLTNAQKAQVQAILEEEHAKMKQSFEQAKASGSKPDWQQMKALHQQMEQETLQKLTPVLSAAQLKKFQILSKQMHPHFHHGVGPGADSAAPPAPQS
jgi:ribulose bisphosphate carboxylase small subunit